MEERKVPKKRDQESEEKITVYFEIPSIRDMDKSRDKQRYFSIAALMDRPDFYPDFLDMLEAIRFKRVDIGIAEAQVDRIKFESTDGKFLKLKEGEKIQEKDIKRIYLNKGFVSEHHKDQYEEYKREVRVGGETKLVPTGYLSIENPDIKLEREAIREREIESQREEEKKAEAAAFKDFFSEITQTEGSSRTQTHAEHIPLETTSSNLHETTVKECLELMNVITDSKFDEIWQQLGRGNIPDGVQKIKMILGENKTGLEKMTTISKELKNMPRSLGAQFFSKIGKDPRDPLTNDLYKAAMAGDRDGLSVVYSKLQELKEEKKQTPHQERK